MKRFARLVAVLLVGAIPDARAQPELPQGHPPIGATQATGERPADAEKSEQPTTPPARSAPAAGDAGSHATAMPAGHPRVGKDPPKDRVDLAADLAPGTVEVRLQDGAGQPVASKAVELGIVKQSVEEGESRQHLVHETDDRGIAVFEGLPLGTAFSYRATVEHGPATYASDPFQPSEKGGHRVLIHVFPVVQDINRALVGMRGLVYLQPREDVFQFEVQYQVFNIGSSAWVPSDVYFELPSDAHGFQAQESMQDARFSAGTGNRVALVGTFPPGRRVLSYRFQLDNDRMDKSTFTLPLPPHVAELQVIVEGSRDMDLSVEGFPPSRSVRGENGGWLHVAGRQLSAGQMPSDSVRFTVDGLPIPDRGRWYALGLALVAALTGLGNAFARGSRSDRHVATEDKTQARELLLGELVTLERLRRSEEIGARTYESTRSALLDAIARLDAQPQ